MHSYPVFLLQKEQLLKIIFVVAGEGCVAQEITFEYHSEPHFLERSIRGLGHLRRSCDILKSWVTESGSGLPRLLIRVHLNLPL